MKTNALTPRKYDEGGFTLIELLVVILIIGILAAIAIPAFADQRKRANDAATESDLRNAAVAVESVLSTRQVSALSPATPISGFAEGSEEKVQMDIVVGMTTMGGFTVPTPEIVQSDAIKLSTNTAVSIGGTTGDYTICGFNPYGKRYVDPDNALVYESATGKQREARIGDACIDEAPEDPGGIGTGVWGRSVEAFINYELVEEDGEIVILDEGTPYERPLRLYYANITVALQDIQNLDSSIMSVAVMTSDGTILNTADTVNALSIGDTETVRVDFGYSTDKAHLIYAATAQSINGEPWYYRRAPGVEITRGGYVEGDGITWDHWYNFAPPPNG